MESVIISIKPEWIEKIVAGKKTIEVRKSAPKEVPFRAYIYCSKEKKQDDIIWAGAFGDRGKWNGHIIGEFVCDKITKYRHTKPWLYNGKKIYHLPIDTINTCLSYDEIEQYLGNKDGYGWNISDLKIYDKPRELSELLGRKNCLAADTVECWNCFATCLEINGRHYQPLRRPPQSYMFVEEVRNDSI